MRRRRSSLIQATVFVALLIGAFYSISDACTFVGIVRDPEQPFTQAATDFLNHVCTTSCRDQHQHTDGTRQAGWTLYHYDYDPATPQVVPWLIDPCGNPWTRHSGPEDDQGHGGLHFTVPYTALSPMDTTPTASFNEARNTVTGATADPLATAVVCHVRYSSNHREQDNPHPFIYPNLFGKTYSVIHNGGLYIPDYQYGGQSRDGLETKLTAAFGSLDIFHSRSFARWQHNWEWGIDSEYLAMLYMKYLLVANNYYWINPPAEIVYPEEWAIRRVAQTFNPTEWARWYNCGINGILTDGHAMWGIAKSDNDYPHTVYFKDDYDDSQTRRITSESRWVAEDQELIHINGGQLVRVTGDAGDTPLAHDMDDVLSEPTELRINSQGNSTGDQKEPAISVDTLTGTWVAVWVSGNQVVARWYNQMGMAESDEFVVSTNDTYRKGSPAIAHSPDGNQVTIMWLQATEAGTTAPFKQVMSCICTWNSATHTWTPFTPTAYTEPDCPGYTGDLVRHPRLAISEISGQYSGSAVVWESYNCAVGQYQANAWMVTGNGTNYQAVIPVGTAATLEPDIAYIGFGKYAIVSRNSGGGLCFVVLRQQVPGFGIPVCQAAPAYHPAIARRDESNFVAVYNTGTIVHLTGTIDGNNIVFAVGGQTSFGTVGPDCRPDVAYLPGLGSYICYDDADGANPLDIYGASYNGGLVSDEGVLNQFTAGDQTAPVIAIAPHYNQFYESNSTNHPFTARRMVLWESPAQDGDGLGVAGQFRGIETGTGAQHAWSDGDHFTHIGLALAGDINQSLSFTSGDVYVTGDVNVAAGATLSFGTGVNVYVSPGVTIKVVGVLSATGCIFTAAEPTYNWGGIYVTGSASLKDCIIEYANTGIQQQDAIGLTVDGCTVQKNGTGIYIYAPTKGAPTITGCTIVNNGGRGISLVSTYKANISKCPNISYNGKDGILLTSSNAVISECHFEQNTNFGVNCYASSPTLYCNTFLDDQSGEMYLSNGSYPVLWSSGGVNGGANAFENNGHTLIIMLDSYPVCANGLNRFTIYGLGNYYMQDLTTPMTTRYIKGNEWSQYPPPATSFSPTNIGQWKFDPPGTYAGCGSPKNGGSGAAQTLFEQGFTAEMAGNTAEASTAYTATVSQYPDSDWAQVAAVRLLENQRLLGEGFGQLEAYYNTLQAVPGQNAALVGTAQNMGTRSMVENAQYAEALSVYDGIMAAPPSTLDSVYAAVDYAIAVMRAQNGAGQGGLDSPLPAVTARTLDELLELLQQVTPQAPKATHENFLKPPEVLTLEQNYPNPFNATTMLRYAVPSAGLVRLTVYNIVGQKVATLVDAPQVAGYHTVHWDGSDLASGVYIYQLQAGGQTLTHKMLLLK